MRSQSMELSQSVSVKEVVVNTKECESLDGATLTDGSEEKKRAESDAVLSAERDARLKKVYRKVDCRMLIWYGVLFMLVRASTKNITNSAILNIEKGTGIKHQLGNLTSEQWAWILSIFSYPYIVMEPVSVMLMKFFKPSRWMTRILLTWGIISMSQAATQNFKGLLAVRALLGVAEAGFWPAVLFHMSFWYPAKRTPLRIAFLYTAGQLAGMLSGVMAFGISFMNGVSGLAGWRWLFILEGLPVLLGAIFTAFFLPDYPGTASFLDADERKLILEELPANQPKAEGKTWDWKEVKALAKDPIFYLFVLLTIGHSIGGYSIGLVLPTVLYALKLQNSTVTQLMTMPPYATAILLVIVIASLVRRGRANPWALAIGLELINCGCYIALITIHNAVAKYVVVCLALVCTMSVMPMLWPERLRTAEGTTATGLAIGITSTCGHLAGIVGPQIYQTRFGPSYRVSFAVSIGLLAVAIASMIAAWIIIRRRDKKAAADASAEE